jgi:flavin reductase (DIM6/NTAB) family NADH-FMN oxidoreductase RutF
MTTGDPKSPLACALGRIPSGLFILSARREETEAGILVSWVQQCAFDPPLVSVAIQRGRAIHDWLTEGSAFTLNILDESQTDMIAHFGRGFLRGTAAFDGLQVDRTDSSAPVLSEALAFLECRVVSRCSTGDHELLIAEVQAGRVLGEGHPMVHVRKSGLHY